jgi:hypothetical protein
MSLGIGHDDGTRGKGGGSAVLDSSRSCVDPLNGVLEFRQELGEQVSGSLGGYQHNRGWSLLQLLPIQLLLGGSSGHHSSVGRPLGWVKGASIGGVLRVSQNHNPRFLCNGKTGVVVFGWGGFPIPVASTGHVVGFDAAAAASRCCNGNEGG